MAFRDDVLRVVCGIRRGETMTYREVAVAAGNPKAARAVGAIMRANRNDEIPCHRVVSAGGLGGYNRGVAEKRRRLSSEGARMRLIETGRET